MCGSMSAIILLIANNMHDPNHKDWTVDSGLIYSGLIRAHNMLVEFGDEAVRKIEKICIELHQYAKYKHMEVLSTRSFL